MLQLILSKELVHIFEVEKGWKIKQMANHKKFMIYFPNKGHIGPLTNIMVFKFQTANIEATLCNTQKFAFVFK